MTAIEAKHITENSNVLKVCLTNVYSDIQESAKMGNSEILFSGVPINIPYTQWSMLKGHQNIKENFIAKLKRDGFTVIDDSCNRSAHKTIVIRWI